MLGQRAGSDDGRHTPSAVVARRMSPSRVDRLRVVDPRPGKHQPVQKILRSKNYMCPGARPGAPKCVPGWCGGEEGEERDGQAAAGAAVAVTSLS